MAVPRAGGIQCQYGGVIRSVFEMFDSKTVRQSGCPTVIPLSYFPMNRVQSYRELEIYRVAFELSMRIFAASKTWPAEERYALTDQVRRASRSVGANLAEAWSKRRYEAHFVSKLSDADAENNETEHWLHTASTCGYITDGELELLLEMNRRVGAMLGKMMATAASFVTSSRPEL